MASNKELIKQISHHANNLGLAVGTDGLNNAKLATLLFDLKAKWRDAEQVTAADDAEQVTVVVAEGVTITTRRGILSAGDEIKAEYLGGDAKALAKLIESGHGVLA